MNRQRAMQRLIDAKIGMGDPTVIVLCEKDQHGAPKDIRGGTAKQQDMTLYKGVELVGNCRKRCSILNGCIYIVQNVDNTHVTLGLHADYHAATKFNRPEIRAALEPLVAEVKELLKDKPKSLAVIMRTAHTLDATLKRYVSGVGVFT